MLDKELPTDVIVSLGSPTILNCYAYGFPFPSVTWWKEKNLLPYKTTEYTVNKDHSLLIHSLKLSNLGVYTCQAYNGHGKAASWSVTVLALGPVYSTNPDDDKYMKYVVNAPQGPPPEEKPQYPYRPSKPSPPPDWFFVSPLSPKPSRFVATPRTRLRPQRFQPILVTPPPTPPPSTAPTSTSTVRIHNVLNGNWLHDASAASLVCSVAKYSYSPRLELCQLFKLRCVVSRRKLICVQMQFLCKLTWRCWTPSFPSAATWRSRATSTVTRSPRWSGTRMVNP